MVVRIEGTKPALPGNHGQFGAEVATEDYARLRATQRVTVKPVVPRTTRARPAGLEPEPLGVKQG